MQRDRQPRPDLCRQGNRHRTVRTRAVGRGFARVDPTTPDTLVAFAAKAGSTASDGSGEHSPFTAALLKHIATPGLDVRLALGEVRDAVMASTTPRQEPFVYGSLGGRTISIVDAPAAPANTVTESWAAVRETTSIAVLEEFRRQYPQSVYAAFANARIRNSTSSSLPSSRHLCGQHPSRTQARWRYINSSYKKPIPESLHSGILKANRELTAQEKIRKHSWRVLIGATRPRQNIRESTIFGPAAPMTHPYH